MRNRKNRIVAAVLLVAVGVSSLMPVSATNVNDAKKKKTEAQNNLDDVNNEISEIESAQQELESEMNEYDAQLLSLLTDMDILQGDIEAKQGEIDQANLDLEAAKETEASQYEAMKVRIQYMYEVGDSSIWTAIIGASSITDLLNRVEYVSEVYDYDRKLLVSYQETVQQVADLTEQLNIEMAEMEELELNYEEQQTELESVIAALSAQMDDFDSQLAEAKELASQYAATIQEQNTVIAAAEEEQRKREEAAAAAAAAAAASGSSSSNTATETSGGGSSGSGSSSGSGGGNSGLTDSGLNPPFTTSVSGSDVVAYASQFVGNAYVWGGTSLTDGADCSGFIQSVYAHFGISLPRTSLEQRSVGQEVSYANAQAGDIICYAGHVAIYMGNGRIVHASSPTNGICYGTATYRTILSVRRVL
ncbi:MAG: NlpC/P60 family protein [Roseburia sp.]